MRVSVKLVSEVSGDRMVVHEDSSVQTLWVSVGAVPTSFPIFKIFGGYGRTAKSLYEEPFKSPKPSHFGFRVGKTIASQHCDGKFIGGQMRGADELQAILFRHTTEPLSDAEQLKKPVQLFS